MTARQKAPPGKEHFKVRVVLPNALLHLASASEPSLNYGAEDRIDDVTADWLDDPDLGDSLGFIHWPSITGITWRYVRT
jgi:hypothetical protein